MSRQKDWETKRQKDEYTKRQKIKRQQDKKTKNNKTKRLFDIVISGQFWTLWCSKKSFISSIVYLLYLKQIYLHMQHSFFTIYSLDSISHGGCNVLWSLGRQMVDIVMEYNSCQKCTLGWFSPPTFVHCFICHFFCVMKFTRERCNLQDAIIYLGSRQWICVYYQS